MTTKEPIFLPSIREGGSLVVDPLIQRDVLPKNTGYLFIFDGLSVKVRVISDLNQSMKLNFMQRLSIAHSPLEEFKQLEMTTEQNASVCIGAFQCRRKDGELDEINPHKKRPLRTFCIGESRI